MSIEEAALTEVFGKLETWENPYPAYREFRDRSPFVAQWPIVLLDGDQRQVQGLDAAQVRTGQRRAARPGHVFVGTTGRRQRRAQTGDDF